MHKFYTLILFLVLGMFSIVPVSANSTTFDVLIKLDNIDSDEVIHTLLDAGVPSGVIFSSYLMDYLYETHGYTPPLPTPSPYNGIGVNSVYANINCWYGGVAQTILDMTTGSFNSKFLYQNQQGYKASYNQSGFCNSATCSFYHVAGGDANTRIYAHSGQGYLLRYAFGPSCS